jgi:prepilin-type processing-associated H-X9-DG protein/prepilin-type N-terminal cleavage/methylation domain-containing protein
MKSRCAAVTGFTLMELLVALSVTAILAALVVAAAARGKKLAQDGQCTNNLRQLGIGLHLFVTDVSAYPLVINPAYADGAYPDHQRSWDGAIESELSKHDMIQFRRRTKEGVPYPPEGIWHCPAAYRPSDFRQNEGYEDYGYNCYGLGPLTQSNSLGLGGHYVWSGSRRPAPPVKESEVASPSEMMAIADGFHGGSGVVRDGAGWLMRDSSTQDNVGSTKRAYARHDGKATVVFCDGHVESPKLPFLFEDMSDAALVRWNRDHQPHRDRL